RRIDQAGAAQPFGILLGQEVVGYDREIDTAPPQRRDQHLDQRGLSRADRTADAHPRRAYLGAPCPWLAPRVIEHRATATWSGQPAAVRGRARMSRAFHRRTRRRSP